MRSGWCGPGLRCCAVRRGGRVASRGAATGRSCLTRTGISLPVPQCAPHDYAHYQQGDAKKQAELASNNSAVARLVTTHDQDNDPEQGQPAPGQQRERTDRPSHKQFNSTRASPGRAAKIGSWLPAGWWRPERRRVLADCLALRRFLAFPARRRRPEGRLLFGWSLAHQSKIRRSDEEDESSFVAVLKVEAA